ncbi:MAG: histidine kinase, partial [Caldithrix sp.]|nr:histidine kinase [Caldithrix sp.]
MDPVKQNLITTEKELCRVCYTCVRDCPAKAIRITGGQAEVIHERCIGCGNCVKVCSQNAKKVAGSIEAVQKLLQSSQKTAAIVAPSFPVEYTDISYESFVAGLRNLGFDYVSEVSFGADLVAQQYKQLINTHADQRYIATTCPAIVSYIEKYHPDLVQYLAPIVSPMIASARVIHKKYGDDVKVVFIGPCFAKKLEASRRLFAGDVHEVITFTELNELFENQQPGRNTKAVSDFDPPLPGLGALFPISRGMLHASEIEEDLLQGDVIAADGKSHFVQAIKEFENGALTARLLEVLCCSGCIMGPGISKETPFYTRQNQVRQYARKRIENMDVDQQQHYLQALEDIQVQVEFNAEDCRIPLPSKEDIEKVLAGMGKFRPEDELDCGACGYETCREHAIAIHKDLAENEMCLPFTIDRLKQSLNDLHQSNEELATTQQALIAAEKMAGMGQLSAGIAHEINNPVGFINSNLSTLEKYARNLVGLQRVYQLFIQSLDA